MLSLRTGTLAAIFALAGLAQAQYTTGPRGGCYTTTKSGNKRYVDRSLCAKSSSDANTQKSAASSKAAPSSGSSTEPVKGAATKQAPSASGKYIKGPKGGCYTLTPSGNKRYVDRSLCK